MLSTKATTKLLCSPKQAAQLSRLINPLLASYPTTSGLTYTGLRLSSSSISITNHHHHRNGAAVSTRKFSTTPSPQMKDWFPSKETEHIRQTLPAWPHHGYTEAEMLSVVPVHRPVKTWGDWAAYKFVKLCRWGMDVSTGLRDVPKINPETGEKVMVPRILNESQWLVRFIFLESIAGVPGMVAGMLRHLHSLRRLKRDNGWIETLLEESYNERLHLLSFLQICEPGWFMKTMILGAQGIYFNALFLSYLISPKITHRFVGYLEEEAVHTYTTAIEQIEAGHLEKWSSQEFQVPDIAVNYWRMPEGKRTMKDLLLYIRADEACHRGVNHTLSNLKPEEDPNPFVSEYKGDRKAPKALGSPMGYERQEVM